MKVLQILEDKINNKILVTIKASMKALLIQLLVENKILITKEKESMLTLMIQKQQKEEQKERESQQYPRKIHS